MHQHYRTKAFFLRKTDRGEADQVFTLFTEDFGRLEVLGRSIRKITSKLRSGAELFYFSEIEFVQGKGYKTLTDALCVEKLNSFRQDLGKLRVGYQIADIFDKLIKGEEKDENIWQLLQEVFERINNQQSATNNQQFVYFFLWNLLFGLGYGLDFYQCSLCGQKLLPETLYFDGEEGGIVCRRCVNGSPRKGGLQPLRVDTIKLLRLFLQKNWALLSRTRLNNEHWQALQGFSDAYLKALNL